MSIKHKTIELKIEETLNKKIVDEKLIMDNPIYFLLKSSAEKIIEKYKIENMNFLFYFVLDDNINAYTLYIDNYDVICFTTGTMFHIGYTIEKMLHNKQFEKYFLEQNEAELLAQISVYFYYFLFYHEFAHLMFGHCKYIEDKYVMKFMAILDTKNYDAVVDIQTLELHADVIASQIFSQIIDIKNPKIKVDQIVDQIIVSLVTLFNFLYLYDKSYEYKDKIYLPPSERLSLVLSIIFSDCLSKKTISDNIQKVYSISNNAFYDIFKINNNLNRKKSYQLDINFHLQTLSYNWTKIYKELNYYSYLPIGENLYE